MYVHRAIACCPFCNEPEEVWFYKSKIAPTSNIQCRSCSKLYDAEQFITNLLSLYDNSTVSTLILQK